MRISVLRTTTLGACLVGLLGCSATPPTQPAVESAPLPTAVAATGPDLNAGSGLEVQQRRGRRYRYRRIIISGVPYYVPYYSYQNYYLPNYLRTDPQWYYVYAYTGPNFSGSRRMIRIRRDRDRDREWNDRRDWNRESMGDWRVGERD